MPAPRDKDEFALIEAIGRLASARPGAGVAVGIGDDAAVLACGPRLLATTDAMVEGVHFRSSWLTPRALGRRALRAAVSDIAAMAGRPRSVLVGLTLPVAYRSRDALAIMRGVVEASDEVGAAVVGGNLSRGRALSVTLTVLGEAATKPVLRSRARAGDRVWVSGALGDAAAGVKLLERGRRTGALIRAYRLPPLRIELARALARVEGLGAMIDVSDGLVQDLGHVCRASEVAAVLERREIPLSPALRRETRDPLRFALTGGEDYELLFTARPRASARLESLAAAHGCRLTCVGEIRRPQGGAPVYDERGKRLTGGYRHF